MSRSAASARGASGARTAATRPGGTSRSAGIATSPSPQTGSRSSSGGLTARERPCCRRFARRTCRPGAGRCRSAAGRITASSPVPGRRSNLTWSASARSASSFRPVIAGDLTRSALPVGAFEWWLENPGPDPLTVGLLFTWADPPAADGPPAHRPHDVVRAGDVVGISFGDPGDDAPTAMRGSLSIAAQGGDGIELSARATFDPATDTDLWADFAADGRLEADGGAAAPAPVGASGAAVAATVVLEPGERRSIRFAIAWDLPMVEFGAGRRWWKRYTRDWGRSGLRAWDLATHALDELPDWRRRIEAWQAPYLADPERPAWYTMALFNELYFLVDGGSFWENGEVGQPEPPARSRGPVRTPRVRRLPVLRHGRCRLLCVVRDSGALPRTRDGRHPRPARRDPGRRPRDGDHRGVRPAGTAQDRPHRAARRRRAR